MYTITNYIYVYIYYDDDDIRFIIHYNRAMKTPALVLEANNNKKK